MRNDLKAWALAGALALLSSGAMAQSAPTGTTPGGTINATQFIASLDAGGFNENSVALVSVPSTSTAQATYNSVTGAIATGSVIQNRVNVITACSGTTGVTLPALTKYAPITIMNRSGGSCLIWPSIGATVETALGTDGAANASFTMLTNTDVTFRPVPTSGGSVKWLQ